MSNLLVLFLVPLLACGVFFVLPFSGRILKRIAVTVSLLPLAILVYGHSSWIGSSVMYPWLPNLAINFHLSVDALSLVFLYLVAVIIPISLLATRSETLRHPHTFFAFVFLLEALLVGFFTARDLAVFTVFWEAMLLPLYFIISIWGGAGRKAAAFKFLIYMLAGSALMIVGVLALAFAAHGSFNMDELAKVSGTLPHAALVAGVFFLAFAVKTPLFPFHAWLPDAYTVAPTAGTILLSAILSKAGIYGFLRIGMELFSPFIREWSVLLLSLAIAGVFYGGLAAWMQNDFKRLIAYSSLSHVNFVLAGIFVLSHTAQQGAILQALNHGVTIAALFLVAGWLEERLGSRLIGQVGGLCKFLPQLCWVTLFFVLASVALPGTNNFVGELLILLGLFGPHPYLTAFLALSVILSVIYMLRWMQKIYFEAPSFYQESWIDIGKRELAIALPLVILIAWIGIYPAPVLHIIQPVTLTSLEKS